MSNEFYEAASEIKSEINTLNHWVSNLLKFLEDNASENTRLQLAARFLATMFPLLPTAETPKKVIARALDWADALIQQELRRSLIEDSDDPDSGVNLGRM